MNIKLQTLEELGKTLKENPALLDEFNKDPLKIMKRFQLRTDDKWVYRLVVSALGLTILLIIIGVIIPMSNDGIQDNATVPTIFTALGSAAIGALAGLLAPSPKHN